MTLMEKAWHLESMKTNLLPRPLQFIWDVHPPLRKLLQGSPLLPFLLRCLPRLLLKPRYPACLRLFAIVAVRQLGSDDVLELRLYL